MPTRLETHNVSHAAHATPITPQNSPSGRRVHDSLARLLAECRFEVLGVVLGQEITGHGLTAILVYALEDLVPRRVAQTGEQGDELAADGSGGLVLENDLVQLAGAGDLGGYRLDGGGFTCYGLGENPVPWSGCSSTASQ